MVSVELQNGNVPVYDLTVDGAHEFFANGVLVGNCMDATRYALYYVENAGEAVTGIPEASDRERVTPIPGPVVGASSKRAGLASGPVASSGPSVRAVRGPRLPR